MSQVDYKVTPFAIYNALRHLGTPVFPDVVNLFHELHNLYGVSIYGNTGRHNDRAMKLATLLSVNMAGIANNMESIYYRRKDMTTLGSKVSVLEHVVENICPAEEIVVADDNPSDLLPMALYFPDARCKLIKDWTTDRLLRGIDMNDYPNVSIEPTLRKALLG